MDENVIEIVTRLVSSLGFPIVVCIFLWRFVTTTMRDFMNMIAENTRTLNKICDKLDVWKGDK